MHRIFWKGFVKKQTPLVFSREETLETGEKERKMFHVGFFLIIHYTIEVR
jgi:hypothetical protein